MHEKLADPFRPVNKKELLEIFQLSSSVGPEEDCVPQLKQDFGRLSARIIAAIRDQDLELQIPEDMRTSADLVRWQKQMRAAINDVICPRGEKNVKRADYAYIVGRAIEVIRFRVRMAMTEDWGSVRACDDGIVNEQGLKEIAPMARAYLRESSQRTRNPRFFQAVVKDFFMKHTNLKYGE